jgi:hypothetical protein
MKQLGYMKLRGLIRLSICFLLTSTYLPAVSAQLSQVDLDAANKELDRTRIELQRLTQEHGHLDRRLLEPMDLYIEQLTKIGRFNDAGELINQAMMITRVSEGLYTEAQYPILLKKIENFGNSGDWEATRTWMEHLKVLLVNDRDYNNEFVVNAYIEMTEMHLWGVARDSISMQTFHFRKAEQAIKLALNRAVGVWGPTDPRLTTILYKSVIQHYMQAVAIDSIGSTSLGLRGIEGLEFVRSRTEAKLQHYLIGLRYLIDIRRIFLLQDEPDLIAAALAEMYIGDWQVLFVKPEAAAISYQRSFNGLVAAGLDSKSINRVFHKPKILPLATLVSDWEEAVSAAGSILTPIIANSGPVNLSFSEWSANFRYVSPNVAIGRDYFYRSVLDGPTIFSFSLTGLEEVSRWYSGRHKTFISSPTDLQIIKSSISRSFDIEEMEVIVNHMRFRPRLVDGIPQAVDATLDYQVATSP